MHLRSDSFRPFEHLDEKLGFCKIDKESHATFSSNRNPHLRWSGAPDGTRSFALLCVDAQVPTVGDDVNQEGRTVPVDLPRADFFHWVVANLPPTLSEIPEGSHSEEVTANGKPPGATPHGGIQGINDYTNWFAGDPDMGGDYGGYDGPCPPWNDERVHAYEFILYALDVEAVAVSGSFSGADLRQAVKGHVLASAKLVGLFTLNPKVRAETGGTWA